MASGAPSARWTPPERMHVTLKFLAKLPAAVVDPFAAAVRTVVEAREAPEACPFRLGSLPWPSARVGRRRSADRRGRRPERPRRTHRGRRRRDRSAERNPPVPSARHPRPSQASVRRAPLAPAGHRRRSGRLRRNERDALPERSRRLGLDVRAARALRLRGSLTGWVRRRAPRRRRARVSRRRRRSLSPRKRPSGRDRAPSGRRTIGRRTCRRALRRSASR